MSESPLRTPAPNITPKSIFFPMLTNGFDQALIAAAWQSRWEELEALEYGLKISFLLFENIFIEASILVELGITADDDQRKIRRKVHDLLDAEGITTPDVQTSFSPLIEHQAKTLFPALARWTNQFGLLTYDRRTVERIASLNDRIQFPIFRSTISNVCFVSLERGYFEPKPQRSRWKPTLRNDSEELEWMRRLSHEKQAKERLAYKVRDAFAAEALELPTHYIAHDNENALQPDHLVKSEALQSVLEIGAPNFADVHLTKILALRETKSCFELRAMIDDLTTQIRHAGRLSSIEKLRHEIQKLWMGKFLNEIFSRQKDAADLRVDLMSGAVSLLPGVHQFLSALEIKNSIQHYLKDQHSWVRIFSELRKG